MLNIWAIISAICLVLTGNPHLTRSVRLAILGVGGTRFWNLCVAIISGNVMDSGITQWTCYHSLAWLGCGCMIARRMRATDILFHACRRTTRKWTAIVRRNVWTIVSWFGVMQAASGSLLIVLQNDSAMAERSRIDVMLAEARDLASRGSLLEASDTYEEVIALRPNWPLPYLERGDALSDAKEHERALRSYAAAFEINQLDPIGASGSGDMCFLLARYSDADEWYTRAIDIKPSIREAYLMRGRIRADRGDRQRAAEDFVRAARYPPSHWLGP